MIHENMSSWKELITLKMYLNCNIMDNYCIILLRSYNYDTQATMIQIKKTVPTNLFQPFNSTLFHTLDSTKKFAKSTLFQPDFTH